MHTTTNAAATDFNAAIISARETRARVRRYLATGAPFALAPSAAEPAQDAESAEAKAIRTRVRRLLGIAAPAPVFAG